MNSSASNTSSSAQGYVDDPRNDAVLVYVDGQFVSRNEAVVSVFDSGFVLGDGIWEGLRLVNGRLVALEHPTTPTMPRQHIGTATRRIRARRRSRWCPYITSPDSVRARGSPHVMV